MAELKVINRVQIRCYRECRFNTFHKSNCGYCVKDSVYITKEGCMDHQAPQDTKEVKNTSTNTAKPPSAN